MVMFLGREKMRNGRGLLVVAGHSEVVVVVLVVNSWLLLLLEILVPNT